MDVQPTSEHEEDDAAEPGLFKKYPKLGVILIAAVAYIMLIGMFLVVVVLVLRAI